RSVHASPLTLSLSSTSRSGKIRLWPIRDLSVGKIFSLPLDKGGLLVCVGAMSYTLLAGNPCIRAARVSNREPLVSHPQYAYKLDFWDGDTIMHMYIFTIH